ncbi:unnamed protein product, partial [Allacma fusca]
MITSDDRCGYMKWEGKTGGVFRSKVVWTSWK